MAVVNRSVAGSERQTTAFARKSVIGSDLARRVVSIAVPECRISDGRISQRMGELFQVRSICHSGRDPGRNEQAFSGQDEPHTLQIGVLGISRVSIQPFLGAEEIHRVKSFAKRGIYFFELRTILVAGLSRFVQVVNAHCELELKGFGFLFVRDLKAFAQITFSFIQILA